MRVISGQFKGKKLLPPGDDSVRPTADRIKETLFNILFSKGAVGGYVLDLFSGSGALGIEALSRGADGAVFVDKSAQSAALTRSNIERVGAKNCEVYNTDYAVALRKLSGRKFALIFLDPPYKLKLEADALASISQNDLLEDEGVIIIEHSKENRLQIDEERFIIDERKCGNTMLTFLTKRRKDK